MRAWAAAILLLATSLLAQQSATFSWSNVPLSGLTKDDFQLLDNGDRHRISQPVTVNAQAEERLPDVFSNRVSASIKAQSNVTVILLDAPGAKLRVVHDFTTDSSDLLAALDQTSADPFNRKEICSLKASTAEQDYLLQHRIEETLQALAFIAEHVAVFPGRKSLVWVSGGFPLSVEFGSNTGGTDNKTIDISAADQQQTMRILAARTGGKAFTNRNDLDGAISEAVADSGVSYSIGFYPTEPKFDGSYHKLTLKLNRRHSELRYRDGYLDLAKPAQDQKTRGGSTGCVVCAARPNGPPRWMW